MRVQVAVWLAIEQLQPVPDAAVGVSPVGTVSVTVTVVPSVAVPPPLVTASAKLPVPPRIIVAALAVLATVRSTGAAVAIVTSPVAAEPSPPPLTLPVLVIDAAAFPATSTLIVMSG